MMGSSSELEGTRINVTALQMVQRQAHSQFRDEDEGDENPDESSVSDEDEDDEGKIVEANNNNNNKNGPDVHDTFVAKEAARKANCAGYCVLVSLISVGVILAVIAFFYVSGQEEDDFQREYDVVKIEVVEGVHANTASLQEHLQSLALLFPSRADNTIEESPQVTVADFEAFAMATRENTGAATIVYSPWLATDVDRDDWGWYSESHVMTWLRQAYAIHPELETVPEDIRASYVWHYINESPPNVEKDPGPGPYAAAYQVSPPPTTNDLVNFNLASVEFYFKAAETTNVTTVSLLTEPVNMAGLYGSSFRPAEGHESDPHSMAIVPVPASLMVTPAAELADGEVPPSEMVTGHLSAAIPWTSLFENILQAHQNGITVVVNSCSDVAVHTYQINGKNAEYLGEGDLHEPGYDSYAYSTFYYGMVDREALTGRLYCKHELTVYPNSTYEDYFVSNSATTYAVTIAAVAFFAIVLFLSYDIIVRRQQSLVLGEAERSNAIVASLFPGKVARRLFMDTSRHSSGLDISTHSTHSNNLLNFMSKGEHKTVEAARPIAELFPEATVMFADIAGFTAWSSIREPQQVFMLLESIFQAFDGIAKSFGVFKVETVGDCYVACCGVPEPNEDHATVMAQFARECLRKFYLVVQDLELKLGPDTSDLAMRFGLNSGPVTAGVLRGERARFQLFGDTVNTAARMESTGARNRIHLSEQTADLLVAHGRGSWIKAREDAVQAKGKGTLSTFWLQEDVAPPRLWQENENVAEVGAGGAIQFNEDDGIDLGDRSHHSAGGLGDGSASGHDPDFLRMSGFAKKPTAAPMEQAPPVSVAERKTSRLVDWNTELLMQLLKQVVARRFAVSGRRTQPDALWEMARNVGEGHMPVEEVVEIIQMPDFDERAIRQVDPDTVILSPEVSAQCRTYVGMLASMYRDNPFHNFEHASHVTMSVSKLLSRIVAPEINKELLNDGTVQELLLHDHTYGITSDPLTQFSVVLSALIHDVDHRGVPNNILNQEDQSLARTYEEKSVAEQNSVDLAWNTLMRPEFGELRSCIFSDITELRRFRALLINSVIATDIFDKEQGTMRKNRWAKAFAEDIKPDHRRDQKDQNRKATIVIEHLIQASDVAHTMQHWHVYQKWNERLFQEMYEAYLTGRSDKDPSAGWYKGELWFYDNYIIPLAKKLKDCGVFGVASDEYLNYALENRREWAAKGNELVNRLVQKYGPMDGADGQSKFTAI
eukprot:CAMPEP_0172473434 /NCGR_PEP_ID=MMETSP1065-20121228/68853_1 /TAXON_ID=265537 /ORGANISM="Amphiprora paludosa, Strain CCMP125" /LENGTH=1226 /DNA_ID=CAMNT_0013231609 /DNA_START=188 /DNA_END=3868 /DNA_ORIENTATION=+